MRILLVEDQLDIAGPIIRCLRRDFPVDHATTCVDARLLLDIHTYDLLIIDLGLPDGSGTEICKEKLERQLPGFTIILSGDFSEQSIVFHLENFADDYIAKPFSLAELRTRVKNFSKRLSEVSLTPHLEEGLVLQRLHKQAFIHGKPIQLRRKEFELLSVLDKYIEKPVLKSALLEEVWDEQNEPFSNTIDAHICALRKALRKVSSDYTIQTIRGIGYQLTQQHAGSHPKLHSRN